MRRVDSLEKTLMLGGTGGRRKRGQQRMRWLDGSPTRWTWVWVNSGCWWWTGKPSVLRFMGSQRVGHDWATELNWTEWGELYWQWLRRHKLGRVWAFLVFGRIFVFGHALSDISVRIPSTNFEQSINRGICSYLKYLGLETHFWVVSMYQYFKLCNLKTPPCGQGKTWKEGSGLSFRMLLC